MIPARLANFTDGLCFLSELLNPNRDMASLISLEIARWLRKVPAYIPFVAPRTVDSPWHVPSNEHSDAIGMWSSNTRHAMRELFHMPVAIQALVLYHLIFLLTA